MKQVAAALVKAQKEFGPALKSSTNPHFRSKYADLATCVEAVIDALNNNGIALMQNTYPDSDGVLVETTFVHESGETLSNGKLFVPAAKSDPQGYGSALTYARRYSLMAACGIAPEDDDGNAAVATYKPQAKPVKEPVARPKPAPANMQGKAGDWQLNVQTDPGVDVQAWIDVVVGATRSGLNVATDKEAVLAIFQNNRNIFDRLKLESDSAHKSLMEEFKAAKEKFKE